MPNFSRYGSQSDPTLQAPDPARRFTVDPKYMPNFRSKGLGDNGKTYGLMPAPAIKTASTLTPNKTLPGLSRYANPGAASSPAAPAAAPQAGFAPKRDLVGYGVSAAQIALGAIPTKKAPELQQENVSLTNRAPQGMNYATRTAHQNQITQNYEAEGKARTADATLNMMSRYAAGAQRNASQDNLAVEDARLYDQQQQQHDQVARQQESYNNGLQNENRKINYQRRLEDQRAMSERKGAMLQTGAQNIMAQRAAENSAANGQNSQLASLDIMQRESEARRLEGLISQGVDVDGNQAALDKLRNTDWSTLYRQKVNQYGGRHQRGGIISRYAKGGSLLDQESAKTYRDALRDNSAANRQLREIVAKFIMLAANASRSTVDHATRRIITATR